MKLLLVDGHNILSRAHHAARRLQLTADGHRTSSLTIFILMTSRYVRLVQPTHVAFCWDAGHDYRDRLYPEYKANRMRDEIAGKDDTRPFGQAQEFLRLTGVPQYRAEGWEADDLIAAVVADVGSDSTDPTTDIVVLSGDKDLLQLVGPAVVQVRPPDDEPWTTERVLAGYGCLPEQLASVMALTGDPVDGVPGVRQIGPKRGVKMLAEANWDFEAVLGALDEEQARMAVLSHSLVDLALDYPALGLDTVSVPAFIPTDLTSAALVRFLDRWRLESVRTRLAEGSLWAPRRDDTDAAFAVA